MIKTILITPDLKIEKKVNEFAYQDLHGIRDQQIFNKEDIDIMLPNGSWLHTITTEKGMFITIHKKI